MKRITEETEVTFKDYSELSYIDEDKKDVTLLVNGISIGKIKVWQDMEMERREYIALNYEVVYLDTIKKEAVY